ncbi:hypothetical protein [Bacillus solimangrovi]|uniref:hypothetical protein n=1 Tax=Bacillus solimangrovi TaxID=1305675 RepID=UPI001112E56A|nr:hypothetical protein [Bacillus solimangrovi]
MTASLFVTISAMILLILLNMRITWSKKTRISTMAGMMIAMVVGMLTGLLGGIILGILLNGNLFFSTLISMGVGVVIGFIIGLPTGIISILDGMLSGLMGGMMGAMLGEMISSEYWDIITKVMFIMFIALMLTLFYYIQDETTEKGEKYYFSMIRNPVVLAVSFLAFFYFYNMLGSIFEHSEINSHLHNYKFFK